LKWVTYEYYSARDLGLDEPLTDQDCLRDKTNSAVIYIRRKLWGLTTGSWFWNLNERGMYYYPRRGPGLRKGKSFRPKIVNQITDILNRVNRYPHNKALVDLNVTD